MTIRINFHTLKATVWQPLIKLDLQDVFASLEGDEDEDTVYNYEGAKGFFHIVQPLGEFCLNWKQI